MIGRVDINFPTNLPPAEVLDVCARVAAERWPVAVFEDAESGDVYDSYFRVPFGRLRELFVYRDTNAYDSWEERGADASNANTMVHLLCYRTGRMTVVVDDPRQPEMGLLLARIGDALRDASLLGVEFPEAA